VGRAGLLSYSASSTIAPLWVPANPPFVLGASSRGDLVAFAANDPSDSWLWEFHPAGPIYGMPAYDPDQHRIYFGAVDKRLYALDERGKRVRFWNTNAATTPVDGPSGGAGANVHIGGASGGESVWLADNNAVVYRLGPSDATVPALLPLAWLDDRSHRGSPLNPLASFYLPVADSRVRLSSSTAVTRSPCSTRPPVPASRPGVSPAANRSPRSSRLSPGRRS
jgi:hypothetical protein